MIIKIKQLIIDGDYELKFVRSFRGYKNLPIKGFLIPETDTILINKNLNDQDKITTIIHEFIHVLHPDWPEYKVEKKCLQLSKQLDQSDYIFFQNLLS